MKQGVPMTDVQTGVQLFDYKVRLTGVTTKLQTASEHARVAASNFGLEQGFYDGKARAEMKLFFESYSAHVDKLVMLTAAASDYIDKVLATFDDADKQLIVDAWLEGNH